jgi:hypothetical protein
MHSIFAIFPSFWNLDARLKISLFLSLKITLKMSDPPDQKNPIRAARIPVSFSHFPYSYGLENPKPEGNGLGGRTGQNPPEPTRAQPYLPVRSPRG